MRKHGIKDLPPEKTNKHFTKRWKFKTIGIAAFASLVFCGTPTYAIDIDVNTFDIPVLGSNSAYKITDYDASNPNSLTQYSVQSNINNYTFTDVTGNLQIVKYNSVTLDEIMNSLELSTEKVGTREVYTTSNSGTDLEINEHFTNMEGSISGGAIHVGVDGHIKSITGDFIGNDIKVTTGDGALWGNIGGMIYNRGTIESITGDFINNSFTTTLQGGIVRSSGIYNWSEGDIKSITGNFIGNSGGAAIQNLYLGAHIGEIRGNFINNKTGCIHSSGDSASVDYIEGNFINNEGGAIILTGNKPTRAIIGNFIENHASRIAGAIRISGHKVDNLNANFINNSGEYDYGGALTVENLSEVKNLVAHFQGNYMKQDTPDSKVLRGGALHVDYDSEIININADFIDNHVDAINIARGGAINFEWGSKIRNLTGVFKDNYAISHTKNALGGAIFSGNPDWEDLWPVTLGYVDEDGNIKGGIVNSHFIGNYAISEQGEAKGGAIYNEDSDFNIISEKGHTTVFKDNYTLSAGKKDDNAIYLKNSTLNLLMTDGGKIYMEDNINGEENSTVNIIGDSVADTTFYLLNDISNVNVGIGNTTLYAANNQVHNYNMKSLTLKDNVNFVADVDLLNQTMDRFTANEYGEHTGNLTLTGVNLLSEAPADRVKTEIYFAEPGLKDHVSNEKLDLSNGNYPTTVYAPIYKYDLSYDNRSDGGYFVFTQGSGGQGGAEAFNPAVLVAPVTGTAASQATVNETFKYVFEHADTFTQMPLVERMTKINANKYAIADTAPSGASTDFNENLGSLYPCNKDNKAAWFRPYSTFESMNLKHGPKVDAITYGSLAGFDTSFFEHKHGWHSVGTGYIGYNGSQLNYKGVDTTMNGGLLGYTHTMYKNNFWTALTLSAGASVGESRTMYGKEDFTSLMAGVGSKTGYNFEFKEGKYIVQPIMFMSYTFANTFDYTNAAGVKIKPSPAHSIQLNPSVRLIANTKNGWQPYASVGMVWNVFDQNKVTANSVRLPEMGMKPYVEYGFGIQRNWKDKFTAFGQTMIRNGGRNGIALTAGFRWALGHNTHDHGVNEKVQAPATKKVVKQIDKQKTTRSATKAIIKSL